MVHDLGANYNGKCTYFNNNYLFLTNISISYGSDNTFYNLFIVLLKIEIIDICNHCNLLCIHW